MKGRQALLAEKIDTEELMGEVKGIVGNIDFSEKFKVVRDIIDKVIVSERSGAEVWVYLPLSALVTEKLGYEPKDRNSQDGTPAPGSNNQLEPEPTFSEDKVIPFQFTVKMPPPRYYPMILERDEKGRIVKTKFPEMVV